MENFEIKKEKLRHFLESVKNVVVWRKIWPRITWKYRIISIFLLAYSMSTFIKGKNTRFKVTWSKIRERSHSNAKQCIYLQFLAHGSNYVLWFKEEYGKNKLEIPRHSYKVDNCPKTEGIINRAKLKIVQEIQDYELSKKGSLSNFRFSIKKWLILEHPALILLNARVVFSTLILSFITESEN